MIPTTVIDTKRVKLRGFITTRVKESGGMSKRKAPVLKKEDLSPEEKKRLRVATIMKRYQIDGDPSKLLVGLFDLVVEKQDENEKEEKEYRNKKLKLMEESVELSRTRMGLTLAAISGVRERNKEREKEKEEK